MAKRSMFVGMDVHKESIDVSLAEEGRDGDVLPRRCMKVRYYGLWSATRRADLDRARTLLTAERAPVSTAQPPTTPPSAPPAAVLVCPLCHLGTLTL